MKALQPLTSPLHRQGPVVLVIMDGVALGAQDEGDAVHQARTPTLTGLMESHPWCQLKAHGKAVGLPSDKDMGNSEVGHNAIGAGRVFAQGASLVNDAIESGRLFTGVWQELCSHCKTHDSTLHLLGLLSDGNVHSHEAHLHALIRQAAREGIHKVRIHTLLDGRDVPSHSALTYISRLEEVLTEANKSTPNDYRIASGGGRMWITMDRYLADWPMVERGWQTHVLGQGRTFASAREAIETLRQEHPNANDQTLPAFVIAQDDKPVGPIQDHDAVIFTNFRGDRAIEICRAFEEDDFPYFDRQRRPDVFFAGMMEYDGDLHIPSRFLVEPPQIERTISQYLVAQHIRQFAISETQKYGHVTYFWNGNRSGKFDPERETYVEIPSDNLPFEQRPWMKAAEITDHTIDAIQSGAYDFLRLNYPNGDMVGHTGDFEATILAVETVDLCLARLLKAIETAGGVALITADHGNADDMRERAKDGSWLLDAQGRPKAKTSHSLNPVPFIIYDPTSQGEYTLSQDDPKGLSNIAATILFFLGFAPPDDYHPPLVTQESP